jgi:hypothetical protein
MERWEQMTPEEREKIRQGVRGRCGSVGTSRRRPESVRRSPPTGYSGLSFLSLYIRFLFAIIDALPRVRRAQEIQAC